MTFDKQSTHKKGIICVIKFIKIKEEISDFTTSD